MKSPTKEALHRELTSKTAAINHKDGTVVTPSSLKGIPTPLDSDAESLASAIHNARNLNDVCFGCDGDCSDMTCGSKRSSRGEIESTLGEFNSSPSHQLRDTHDPGGKIKKEKRDLEYVADKLGQGHDLLIENDDNMNISQTDSLFNENEENGDISVDIDSENGNSSPTNSPKRAEKDGLAGGKKPRSPKSPGRNRNGRARSGKRQRSAEGSQEALDEQQNPRKVSSVSYDSEGGEELEEEQDQLNDLHDLPYNNRVRIIFITLD